MNRNVIKKLFLLVLFIPHLIQAEIVEVHTMNQVDNVTSTADHDTLVVFDIDNTLIIPANPAFQIPNVLDNKHLLAEFKKKWCVDQKRIATNLMALTSESKPLDLFASRLLKSLQDRDIPVIALTATLAECDDVITDTLSRRKHQLGMNGFDMSPTAPSTCPVIFDDLKPYFDTYPLTQHGVICSNGDENTKGEVLAEYFRLIGWYPKKVIFVDDSKVQVESMIEPMERLGIEFIGIHFRGIDHFIGDPIDEADFLKAWQDIDEKSFRILDTKKQKI